MSDDSNDSFSDKGSSKNESAMDLQIERQSSAKVMQITKCPHTHRKHYAKVSLLQMEAISRLFSIYWSDYNNKYIEYVF